MHVAPLRYKPGMMRWWQQGGRGHGESMAVKRNSTGEDSILTSHIRETRVRNREPKDGPTTLPHPTLRARAWAYEVQERSSLHKRWDNLFCPQLIWLKDGIIFPRERYVILLLKICLFTRGGGRLSRRLRYALLLLHYTCVNFTMDTTSTVWARFFLPSRQDVQECTYLAGEAD